MFSTLKKLIQSKGDQASSSTQSATNTVPLAAAVLLLEASHIDDECTGEELAHINETVKKTFDLSDECTNELLELANHKREAEVDIWQFTNLINEQYSHQEKISIMEVVWQIIYVDGKLDSHEDYYAHKLANLLRLSHAELIDTKMKAKEAAL